MLLSNSKQYSTRVEAHQGHHSYILGSQCTELDGTYSGNKSGYRQQRTWGMWRSGSQNLAWGRY